MTIIGFSFSMNLHKNVWVLAIAQALVMTVNSVIVFAGGLVGATLAPEPSLATLPVATTVVGTAAFTLPIGLLMKVIGRKKAFNYLLLFSILIAGLATVAIHLQSFNLFCASTLLFGATSATVMQFRFAAMESVSMELVPKAASTVLLGGIVAAFLGPETAVLGKDLLSKDFMGSFALLGFLFLLGLLALQFFRNPVIQEQANSHSSRRLRDIVRQPIFLIALFSALAGYAIMTFIMTATPVSMHVMDGHSLHETKWVIQSHIVAMFLPSLITSQLIKAYGIKKVLFAGVCAYLLCVVTGFMGHTVVNYWISLVLLGIGWNFMFIGGTSLLPRSFEPSERFQVQAFNDFVVFGIQAIASLSAGWFIFSFGWETILLATLPLTGFYLAALFRWKNE